VWKVIDLLIEEAKEMNQKGNEFDIAKSVNSQLPFFACRNKVLSPQHQKDIQRYIYCKEFGVPAYKGSYGDQPSKWVDKSFVIKKALAKKEQEIIDGSRKPNNS
tara:strand:+ start:395 stop:706 length:312 start_codon:yes stop_codon:yes gene_type:complete